MQDWEYDQRQSAIIKALQDAHDRLEQIERQRQGVLMEVGEILRAARAHNDALPPHRRNVDRVHFTEAEKILGISRPIIYRLEEALPDDDGNDATAYSGRYLAELYLQTGDDSPDVSAELRARYPSLDTIEAVMEHYRNRWEDDHPDAGVRTGRDRIPGWRYLLTIRNEHLREIQAGPLRESAPTT